MLTILPGCQELFLSISSRCYFTPPFSPESPKINFYPPGQVGTCLFGQNPSWAILRPTPGEIPSTSSSSYCRSATIRPSKRAQTTTRSTRISSHTARHAVNFPPLQAAYAHRCAPSQTPGLRENPGSGNFPPDRRKTAHSIGPGRDFTPRSALDYADKQRPPAERPGKPQDKQSRKFGTEHRRATLVNTKGHPHKLEGQRSRFRRSAITKSRSLSICRLGQGTLKIAK